jgi:hypothetical protein
MGLAQDLLHGTDHPDTYKSANPDQASLRRAVSTAYYALFHLLVEEAGQRWSGSSEARTGMERAFQHGPMKNTSMQFRKKIWEDWHSNQRAIPSAIQKIASAFVNLQEERHAADYDNHEQWTTTDVKPRWKSPVQLLDIGVPSAPIQWLATIYLRCCSTNNVPEN